MSFGMTSEGFNTKTFDIIEQELYEAWSTSLGKIDTDPDGVFGQISVTLGISISELWEIANSMYMNSDVRTATGAHLDRLMALINLSRKPATKPTAQIWCGGMSGVVIPRGAQVGQSSTNKIYETDSAITISPTSCNQFELVLPLNFLNSVIYSFSLNGVLIKVTGSTTQTVDEVARLFENQLWSNMTKCDISDVVVNLNTITVSSRSPYRPFTLSNLVNVATAMVWCGVSCTCLDYGVNVTPPRSINRPDSRTVGFTNCFNPVSGTSGANVETDVEFRKRRYSGLLIGSSGTDMSLESRIWNNVPNISYVSVSSNRGDTVDKWGRLPHSVSVIVEGGSDEGVANQIFNCNTGAIPTNGDVQYSVTRSYLREPFMVKFARVKTLFGWIKVDVIKKNSEENYPSNAKDLIRKAVYVEAIRGMEVGADVIAQKFLGAIYREVSGLEYIEVSVAVTGSLSVNPAIPVGTPWVYNPSTYASGFSGKVEVAPTDKVEWRDAYNEVRIIINEVQ